MDNEFAAALKPSLDDLDKVQAYVNICDISRECPLHLGCDRGWGDACLSADQRQL